MKSRHSCNKSSLVSNSAFTVAEVVVAVAVVGIAFVSLYGGIFFSFRVTRAERENLRATQVILQRMEGIRLFNWNQITNLALNPSVFYEQYIPAAAGVPAGGVVYTGRVEVASVALDPPATYSASMKKITVTVTWNSGNVDHIRRASTYVAKDGVQNYVYSN